FSSRGLELLQRAQARALGPRVALDLGGRRLATRAPQQARDRYRAAHARQVGRTGAPAGLRVAEAVLHDAVLARVVRQHGAAAARGEQPDGVVERTGQLIELAVHRDAQ